MRCALILAVALLATPTARAQNRPPVVNAGPNQTGYTGDWVTLHGSASDPEGDPIVWWRWEVAQMPPNGRYRLLNDDIPNLMLLPYVAGAYHTTLYAGDGTPTGFGVDSVTVHAVDNLPPVAIATADGDTVAIGDAVCFDGSQSSDPEGGPFTCVWNFADGTPQVFGAIRCHAFEFAGRFSVTLVVTDERGLVDLAAVAVTVLPSAAPSPAATNALRLAQNRPNPFNPKTTIRFDLPEAGPVRLSVFDVAGRLVRTLVDDTMAQGGHEAVWDGRDASGREVGSGSYLARLEFGGRVEAVRMGLVR